MNLYTIPPVNELAGNNRYTLNAISGLTVTDEPTSAISVSDTPETLVDHAAVHASGASTIPSKANCLLTSTGDSPLSILIKGYSTGITVTVTRSVLVLLRSNIVNVI